MSVTFPTVTGYSGFWNATGDNIAYSPIARAQQGWRSKLEWEVARLLNRPQFREQRELMLTLLGVAPGQIALSTYKRVQSPIGPSAAVPTVANSAELGGLVPIETVTVINRVTATADVTYLTSIYDGTMNKGGSGITYVNDAAGNGPNARGSNLGW